MATAQLHQYEAPFVHWLEQGAQAFLDVDAEVDPELSAEAAQNAQTVWASLQALCTVAVAQGLDVDPVRWTPADVEDLLDALQDALPAASVEDAADRPTVRDVLLHSLLLFMSFVNATDRWPATRRERAEILARLTILADPDSDFAQLSAGMRTGEQVDEATEDAAVVALPLVADLLELLTVTDQRRRAELAGEVGELDGPTLEEAMTARTGADDDPLAVRHVWNAAVITNLIEVEGSAATVTATGQALVASPDAAIDEVRRAVLAWLVALVTLPGVMTHDLDLVAALDGRGTALVMPLLARGLSVKPLSTALLGGALESVTDDAPAAHREAVHERLLALLGRLLRSGLLTESDGHYVVPVGLESMIIAAMDAITAVREAQIDDTAAVSPAADDGALAARRSSSDDGDAGEEVAGGRRT